MTRDIYLPILQEIDNGPHEVTKWEADFLETLLKHQPYAISDRRAEIVCQMAQTYLGLEVAP